MEITTIGNLLLDLFELEAFAGLSLLAIVIAVVVRALLDEHVHDSVRPRVGSHR